MTISQRILTGYKDKVEVHIGRYGNIIVHEIFSPTRRLKRDIPKSQIMKRLKTLEIKQTIISKTPCHHCGLLCSPSAKRCPKCGELLIFNF
jgi:ribosomal protein L40E